MQKKVLVVAAMLALFVCGGVFAQEAEVPETEAPVAETPAAETPETEAPAAESSGGGGGKRPPMYIGVEMGYSSMNSLSITAADFNISGHLGGFELVPSFGIAPFSKLPDLALEFNLMMDFMKLEIKIDDPEDSDSTITQTTKIAVIAPQILAVYTFCEGPVRPFLGAGFGVNINSARFSPGSLKLKLGASFGVVTKAGVVATIPNTKFDLLFLARHNLNISKKMEYEGFSIENLRMNLSTISFVLGGRFNF
ncbi:MAG: hypothetical protein J6K76_00320 [Spirochaetaceae bacterium]|nr:hypothetical protein [Spirochaetaceae bacterium]